MAAASRLSEPHERPGPRALNEQCGKPQEDSVNNLERIKVSARNDRKLGAPGATRSIPTRGRETLWDRPRFTPPGRRQNSQKGRTKTDAHAPRREGGE